MRIRVSHETKLTFSAPARALHLALRMTPRSFESQYVLRWRVGVDLDVGLKPREDAFGSVVHSLSWHRPVEAVTVAASGEIETSDSVGVVRGAVDPLPAPMYLRDSPLAHANAALREFAQAIVGADPLDRLHRLMAAVHTALAYEPGLGGESSASEIFALKKGGSADFAHVFVAAARAWQVPARLVTGYCVGEAGEPGAPSAPEEMCAWAEALTPGLGWVGFDAVHDLCPNGSYVRVAAGLDANDAAPLRYWTSAAETAVTARLRVEQAGSQSQN
jgi:transglutaminase-like putative cysteine protease